MSAADILVQRTSTCRHMRFPSPCCVGVECCRLVQEVVGHRMQRINFAKKHAEGTSVRISVRQLVQNGFDIPRVATTFAIIV